METIPYQLQKILTSLAFRTASDKSWVWRPGNEANPTRGSTIFSVCTACVGIQPLAEQQGKNYHRQGHNSGQF